MHPLQEQRDSVRDWRQIGLGIFGLADMLIKMGIRYGSSDSLRLCDEIGRTMARAAITSSLWIAEDANPYLKWNAEKVMASRFAQEHMPLSLKDRIFYNGLANSQLLTIAPTGSLSSMLGVSGGIEPIYANYYERKTESLHGHDEYYKVYTPIVKTYMEEHGLTDDSQLPDYFITAQDLNYKERIGMQSVWQEHIDASISSTVNVPNDFTIEQVEDLYMLAWQKGLKGVTIFRDGCKRTGILSTTGNLPEQSTTHQSIELQRGMIIKADDNCVGRKRTLRTGCGTLHCEAFFDPDTGELLETYFSKGSLGGCNQFMIGLSRLISLAARAGVDIYSIVDQLKSSGTCPSYAVRAATKKDTSKGSSCPVAIGNALIDMYEELQRDLSCDSDASQEDEIATDKQVINPCPKCGEELRFEGGCMTCPSCGWTKCD